MLGEKSKICENALNSFNLEMWGNYNLINFVTSQKKLKIPKIEKS